MERVELTGDLANVAVARQAVRRCLGGLSGRIVVDSELIVSELVTNAIVHGPPGSVVVEVGHDDDGVRMAVTSPAPPNDVDSPGEWSLPDAGALGGRGLAIVRALADDVHVRSDHERLTIAVTVGPETPD